MVWIVSNSTKSKLALQICCVILFRQSGRASLLHGYRHLDPTPIDWDIHSDQYHRRVRLFGVCWLPYSAIMIYSELSWCFIFLHDIIDYYDPTSLQPPEQATTRLQLLIWSGCYEGDCCMSIIHSNNAILPLVFERIRPIVSRSVCRRRSRNGPLEPLPSHHGIILGP